MSQRLPALFIDVQPQQPTAAADQAFQIVQSSLWAQQAGWRQIPAMVEIARNLVDAEPEGVGQQIEIIPRPHTPIANSYHPSVAVACGSSDCVHDRVLAPWRQ